MMEMFGKTELKVKDNTETLCESVVLKEKKGTMKLLMG